MIQTYVIHNTLGASLTLCNVGASILSFKNREGVDYIIGDKDPSYITHETYPYFGSSIGTLAGRTSTRPFIVEEEEFTVPANENSHVSLHGGATKKDRNDTSLALSFRLWKHKALEHPSMQGYIFYTTLDNSYISNTANIGITAEIQCLIALKNRENTIHIEYKGSSPSTFPINLTNHSYFNLGDSTILSHSLSIPASSMYVLDDLRLNTGTCMNVSNSPYDIRPTTYLYDHLIEKKIEELQQHNRPGIDDIFKIDANAEKHNTPFIFRNDTRILHLAATLCWKNQRLRTFTSTPALVCYTGNFLDKHHMGERPYAPHEGICFETQYASGFNHHTNMPQSYARKNNAWIECTEYVFDTINS